MKYSEQEHPIDGLQHRTGSA